jgi:hypothetical protein
MKSIVVLFVFMCGIIHAQIGMGEWRFHVFTFKAIDIAANDQFIFTAYENGLSILNLSDETHELYTSLNGLSDIEITCIFYDEVDQALFIGYANGNIDKYKDNRFYNIPALKLANVANSKRINKFTRAGNFVLAANDFSILKIDPNKNEVKETFYPTNALEKIQDVVFFNDTVFALTPTRLLKGNYNNPALPDQSQWFIDSRLIDFSSSGYYAELEVQNGDLLALFQTSLVEVADTVFILTNSGMVSITANLPSNVEINSINVQNNKLILSINGGALIYGSSYELLTSYSPNTYVNIYNSLLNEKGLWAANKGGGLCLLPNETSYKGYGISGPFNNDFYSMDWNNGKLAIASGRLLDIQPSYNKSGIHFFEDESWGLKSPFNIPEWQNKDIRDFLDVSINPTNKDEVAVSTYSPEALSVIKPFETDCYNEANSTLSKTSLGNGWCLVSDVCYDEQGNLWSINGYTEKPLNVLTTNKTWKNFYCGFEARNRFTQKMIVDFDNLIWFSVLNEGLFAYNYNGTIEDESDDQYKQITNGSFTGDLPSPNVTAIAADFNGEIWIGTDAGFAILYNASEVFDANAGDYNAQRIKINFEGNVEYLLGSTHITDIEVDGGNRKWMATASSGLILLSADGNEILETLTTENSPLISNVIYDIKLNHDTGELFIITDRGLVSYRTDASYEDPDYESTIVFPNPVRPNFFGPVTIQGIRYDSDVKITDVAGNLVFKTTSNGGTATWDCKTLNGQKVASGVYFIWTATNEGKDKKVGKVLVIN